MAIAENTGWVAGMTVLPLFAANELGLSPVQLGQLYSLQVIRAQFFLF
jgi:hypothetical protein